MKSELKKYLTLELRDVNMPVWELTDHLAPGWKSLINLMAHFEDECHDLNVSQVRIDKGLLRISYPFDTPYREDYEILSLLAEDVARKSAVTCLVCGHAGVRRKLEAYWPCLCKKHYLEYVNSDE